MTVLAAYDMEPLATFSWPRCINAQFWLQKICELWIL